MSIFQIYFHLGFRHICDLRATDHLAFLLALCAPFALGDWRRVLALVSSFTVGHSLTLALATLGVVVVNPAVVEMLIPLTIMATAGLNMARVGRQTAPAAPVLWAAPNALALGFGLIHGLGFAGYLGALLGAQARPVVELLAFNLGVEAGQVLIVAGVLAVAGLALGRGRVARRDWVLAVSGAALGIAALLLWQLLLAQE